MKFHIIVIVSLFSNCSILLGQSDCNKKIAIETDEFTGLTSVTSMPEKIIDMTGKHLLNELWNKDDKIPDWYLSMFFMAEEGKYYVFFNHYSFGQYATKLDYVYLKMMNDSIIKLEEPYSFDEVEDGPNTSYINTFFEISEKNLRTLSQNNIKKIRVSFWNQPREPICETELVEKKSTKVKNLAACFYEKAPKPKED